MEPNIFLVDYPSRLLQIEMKYEVEWDYDTLFIDLISDENSQRIFSSPYLLDSIFLLE